MTKKEYGFKGTDKEFDEMVRLMESFNIEEFNEGFDYTDLFEDKREMKRLHDFIQFNDISWLDEM